MLLSFGVAYVVGSLSRLNYNAWYGSASYALVQTTLQQLEEGNEERVLTVLRGPERQYSPTYENKAHHDVLTRDAVDRMSGRTEIAPGSPWDASDFDERTWLGHWEDGYGYWIMIDDFLGLYQLFNPVHRLILR